MLLVGFALKVGFDAKVPRLMQKYVGMHNRLHRSVRHSVGEYVRRQAHTNGIESFWAMLKRGYQGVYHQMSPHHLRRYVTEFEGRHNDRPSDTIDQLKGNYIQF